MKISTTVGALIGYVGLWYVVTRKGIEYFGEILRSNHAEISDIKEATTIIYRSAIIAGLVGGVGGAIVGRRIQKLYDRINAGEQYNRFYDDV